MQSESPDLKLLPQREVNFNYPRLECSLPHLPAPLPHPSRIFVSPQTLPVPGSHHIIFPSLAVADFKSAPPSKVYALFELGPPCYPYNELRQQRNNGVSPKLQPLRPGTPPTEGKEGRADLEGSDPGGFPSLWLYKLPNDRLRRGYFISARPITERGAGLGGNLAQ